MQSPVLGELQGTSLFGMLAGKQQSAGSSCGYCSCTQLYSCVLYFHGMGPLDLLMCAASIAAAVLAGFSFGGLLAERAR
jgi:hypothetical protein